jgi:hypothetical protein
MHYRQFLGYVNYYCLCYGETIHEGGAMLLGTKLFLSMGVY